MGFFSGLLCYCSRDTDKRTLADGRHLERRGEIFVTSVSEGVICKMGNFILHSILGYSTSRIVSFTDLRFRAAVGLISLMFA